MKMNSCFLLFCTIFLLMALIANGQLTLNDQHDRWSIQPDKSIQWTITDLLPHKDHIEMSGEKLSAWIEYNVDSTKAPHVIRTVVFPTFRTKPNDTHASLMFRFSDADLPRIFINGQPMRTDWINGRKTENIHAETKRISQHGIMKLETELGDPAVVRLEQSLFPSVEKPLLVETFVFKNISAKQVTVTMEYLKKEIITDTLYSTRGPHRIIMETLRYGTHHLEPNDSVYFAIGYHAAHPDPEEKIDPEKEAATRRSRIDDIGELLRLETPEQTLNTAFDFAKIRASESIYRTRRGLMHSPGGLTYYAAIWANDQAEYVNPFFAFLGDVKAGMSAMNAYRIFASYMNPQYVPIPSSIVAEGDTIWNGAGDRGDMAMIAYGASRFALSYGNKDSAQVLWPLIHWCLEYCKRKINAEGVVASNTDELEGRFPAGKANLSTSVLYYDALRSASMLAKELGIPSPISETYSDQAKKMKASIEKFFGATVEGFKTYRYYEGNDVLRSWICLPLTAQLFDRKQGTIDALFSPRLWTSDGLATQAGDSTFWDRSTLYALRGVLQAGEVDTAMRFLRYYSQRRLLGEHVPYPVEAYPEGNQRHLSAESGLYCRIYTEGLFGIRPTGLRSFDCTPRLPREWDHMALRNIHAFGNVFSLEIIRDGKGKLSVNVITGTKKQTYRINNGASLRVNLTGQ